jgi:excinuclease UvrABC ATPase subunit
MTSSICPNCKGNGFNKLRFEAEEVIEQCDVCNSSGELDKDKHYRQSWDGAKVEGIVTRTVYFGPLLDPESFPNYKIHGE